MRVLIIQDQLRVGGTEKQSLQMATDLAAAGHHPVLLLFRPGGQLLEKAEACTFPVHILQPFDSGVSLWAPGLRKNIRQLNPDILICMGRTANCYAGYLNNWFPAIPVIATVRTGKRLLTLHTRSLDKATCIVVNTAWWRQELIKRGHSAEAIHVIRNPALLDASAAGNPSREELRRDMGAGDKTCVFLNVSTFRPGKRHKDLLKAFQCFIAKHPEVDTQLWLVGSGRTFQNCGTWCAVNGLEEKVRFFGYNPNPGPIYAAADVAFSLSLEDSLPNFLIEAQMFGLPVIARDYKGVRETFEIGKSGILVKTNSPETLVPILRQMATDLDLRKAFSTTAKTIAARRFDRTEQTRKLLSLLRKIKESAN